MKTLALALPLALLSSTALAGWQYSSPPAISSGFVYGDLRSTRTSSTADALLGCGVTYNAGIGTEAYCYADDGTTSVSCTTTDSGFIEVVKSMNSYGYLSFAWDTSTGECTGIGFDADSAGLP